MPSPSEGIKTLLVNAGIGAFASTSDWGIYIDEMPVSPDRCIVIYDTGGQTTNPRWLVNFPSVQVAVRGHKGDYPAAYSKCEAIRNALLGLPSQNIGSERWTAINAIGDINRLGQDENGRPRLSLNFALIIEPTSGTYRESL